MLLGGVPIEDRQVLQIAGFVDPALGIRLVTAYRLHYPVVALTVPEREAILAALDAAAPALGDLRDALGGHDAWQMRKGLRR